MYKVIQKVRKTVVAIRTYKHLREAYEALPNQAESSAKTQLELDVATRFSSSVLTAQSYLKNEVYVNMALASGDFDYDVLTEEERRILQDVVKVCPCSCL
jgi:hypothetical protein